MDRFALSLLFEPIKADLLLSDTQLGMLHGIAFGLLVRWPAGKIAVQAGGGLIALAGVGFLTGVL